MNWFAGTSFRDQGGDYMENETQCFCRKTLEKHASREACVISRTGIKVSK